MRFSITCSLLFTLAILASASPALTISQRQDEDVQDVADLANELNEYITSTTQFFEAFLTLSGSALTTQASTAFTALNNAISRVSSIVNNDLPDNTMAQVIKGTLLDNDFLVVGIGNQLEDFALDQPSNPFSQTLGLYCSDTIPEINTLFQIVGSFINKGTTITALLPNNCPS